MIQPRSLFACLIPAAVFIGGCIYPGASDKRAIDLGPAVSDELGLMTFNIRYGTADDGDHHWEHRRQHVIDLLAEARADVIGLQEALHFQVRAIQTALPQYQIISTGRDDGLNAGEACPILYRKDRFSAADSGTFWFSNTPWKPASKHWGNEIPRICTWARLIETQTGRAFYVYNLHLDHQSQPSREQSVRLLARRIAARDPKDPFVVMGDFNIGMNNPAMLYLQKIGYDHPGPRLIDSWQMVHPAAEPVGTYHGFTGAPKGPKIDHILVTEGAPVLRADIDRRSFDGLYPSDHYPVTATVRIVPR